MELSLCHTKAHNFCSSSIPIHKTRDPSTLNPSWGLRLRPWQNHGLSLMQQRVDHKKSTSAVVVRCADTGCSSGPVSEIEGELEAEIRPEDGAEEWLRVGRLREKCGDRGMVELLECLEREAIMGEDEGKEPNDYNRRAQIFYKSSRVFQALKERNQS
ncbi:unnamed protein product [Prunus armeniaca]|uniref:Uncharacterized protein n=1 Tax=Prunus armeniaca TaxID=36596 RepID=A0A6J5WIZ4_PRUAR|nr:unnamed protein product [Prunus armeniaca]